MTASKDVLLGFEVGTGEPVRIPLRHMVVSGQTQEAGKTTTLEALITRAGMSAIAFITKRGEGSFNDVRQLPPYFRERADWQFVSAVLEAALQEKLRFERAWIMKASAGARSLAEVQQNVKRAMEKARGMSADIYLTLYNYLEIVVPRVARIQWAKSIDLAPGINVMDIADRDRFPVELQGLVMRSALEFVYEHCSEVITIIPEAWEFLPQGRGSPVKLECEQLIRKGAGLRNFVWFDSQDIGGVDKAMLRHCPVWLLGVQREANEIDRTLANIPGSVRKPKKADIALLKRGQFFACHGEHVTKVYVQPTWMEESLAREIAQNQMDASAFSVRPLKTRALVATPIPQLDEMLRKQAIDEGYYRAVRVYFQQVAAVIDVARKLMDELQLLQTNMDTDLRDVSPGEARDLPASIEPDKSPKDVVALKTRKVRPSDLSPSAIRLLCAIARYPQGLNWRDACVVAGMAYGNGFMYSGKKQLLDAGLVEEVSGGDVLVTKSGAKLDHAKGAAAAGPLSLQEIVTQWGEKLDKPSPEMLDLLASNPEHKWTTEDFAAKLNRKPGNGFWYGGLSRLRASGLLDPKEIRLSLFLRFTAHP